MCGNCVSERLETLSSSQQSSKDDCKLIKILPKGAALRLAAAAITCAASGANAYIPMNGATGGNEESWTFSSAGVGFTFYDYNGNLNYFWTTDPPFIWPNIHAALVNFHEHSIFWDNWSNYIGASLNSSISLIRDHMENGLNYWPWEQAWDSSCSATGNPNKVDGWSHSVDAYSGLEDRGSYIRYFVHEAGTTPYAPPSDWPECFIWNAPVYHETSFHSIKHMPNQPTPQPSCEPNGTKIVTQVRCHTIIPHIDLRSRFENMVDWDLNPLSFDGSNTAIWSIVHLTNYEVGATDFTAVRSWFGTFDGADSSKVFPAVLDGNTEPECPPWECGVDPWTPQPDYDGPSPVDPAPTDGSNTDNPDGGSQSSWLCIPLWMDCGQGNWGENVQREGAENAVPTREYDFTNIIAEPDGRLDYAEDCSVVLGTKHFQIGFGRFGTRHFDWDLSMICTEVPKLKPVFIAFFAVLSIFVVFGSGRNRLG